MILLRFIFQSNVVRERLSRARSTQLVGMSEPEILSKILAEFSPLLVAHGQVQAESRVLRLRLRPGRDDASACPQSLG